MRLVFSEDSPGEKGEWLDAQTLVGGLPCSNPGEKKQKPELCERSGAGKRGGTREKRGPSWPSVPPPPKAQKPRRAAWTRPGRQRETWARTPASESRWRGKRHPQQARRCFPGQRDGGFRVGHAESEVQAAHLSESQGSLPASLALTVTSLWCWAAVVSFLHALLVSDFPAFLLPSPPLFLYFP